ncbi:MAG: hypothetical protein JWR27_2803 [Aeromicrobium sp.]|jgi:hypothetical protein|nr:hypothetical protein [Aeromicrobium sp.]
MGLDLHLAGANVTLYGERDVLDVALSQELGRRGCSTHAVSTPLGWLRSAKYAVLRLTTPSGDLALRELTDQDEPPTHVVAVCEKPVDNGDASRIEELCRQCGQHHDVTLIWHQPMDRFSAADTLNGPTPAPTPADLAATIADEIGVQRDATDAPSFATQTYVSPDRS